MSFKDVRNSISSSIYRQVGRASSQIQKGRALPVDILESEDSYLVVFDAPGAESEDVQVRYIEGTVKVRIDRFREFYEGFEMAFPGRSMAIDGEAELPADALVTPDAGTARLSENGTLNIEIPKDGAAPNSASDTATNSDAATNSNAAFGDDRISIDD